MRILYVHQSADLYGSDRTLLTLVDQLRTRSVESIVVLPEDGPLVKELLEIGVETHVLPVVKISRSSGTPGGLLRILRESLTCCARIDGVLGGRSVDIVHSNTVAVLAGLIWARRKKIPHLWHVHEIITHPKLLSDFFPWLVSNFSERIICNSTVTRDWIVKSQPSAEDKTITIWNGISPIKGHLEIAAPRLREKLSISPDSLIVTLVGRINRFKGQNLLVDAIEILSRLEDSSINAHFLIVGSPPAGQEEFLHRLQHRIQTSPAKNRISILDFTPNINEIWEQSDIAVVPSTEPEPFGLVAIEAMRAGKPVIGAAHGGLKDIIVDGETGLLFPPNDADAFAFQLLRLLRDSKFRERMGTVGRIRQQQFFTLEAHANHMSEQYVMLSNAAPRL